MRNVKKTMIKIFQEASELLAAAERYQLVQLKVNASSPPCFIRPTLSSSLTTN
jgi:hypothetical protein